MARQLITEKDVRDAIASGVRRIDVAPDGIITPLAGEIAEANGIELGDRGRGVEVSPMTAVQSKKQDTLSVVDGGVVAFGSDHGGVQLKGVLMKQAQSLGYAILDLGTSTEKPCDYPDFAYAVGRAVASGEAWRGVMIDGAGIGSCVVANKIPGIRAACCHNELVARNAREHNDTNVLTLGSRVTGVEVCKEILRVWLGTMFAGGRHQGRVDKIRDVERRYLK
jgi:ribose 5-phosphate isomerase B